MQLLYIRDMTNTKKAAVKKRRYYLPGTGTSIEAVSYQAAVKAQQGKEEKVGDGNS